MAIISVDCPYKWKKTPDKTPIAPDTGVSPSTPKARHGHRAVQIKELIIVFGGGNEGIVDELHVFNTTQNAWFVPQCKGDTPPGCAAFGFAVENTRLLVYGGMVEYGKYSGELYELQATKWEWKKLRPKPPRTGPVPCPRLGHSFTLVNKKIYMFGGLCNNSPDPKANSNRFLPFRYLNDLYVLDISKNPHQWEIPETQGTPPSPRESHTAVVWKKNEGTLDQKDYLVLYGGMCGQRLGDLWMLDLDTLTWQKPILTGTIPSPRSLHTAVVGNNKMFVFGGWVSRDDDKEVEISDGTLTKLQKEWKCTNSLGVFDFEKTHWDNYVFGEKPELPSPRAGHCAAMVHNRMYVWSGRDGYKKSGNRQVCCSDMWFLETSKPGPPGKVQLSRAATSQLDVHWTPAITAEKYHLQIQVYESPPTNPQGPNPVAISKMASAPAILTTSAASITSAGSTTSTPTTATTTLATKTQLISVPQGKNLPSGAQFVTLMKPGTTQGITLTPGSAVPVSSMVKLVPQSGAGQGAASPAANKSSTILLSAQKGATGAKQSVLVVPTPPASTSSTPPTSTKTSTPSPTSTTITTTPSATVSATPPTTEVGTTGAAIEKLTTDNSATLPDGPTADNTTTSKDAPVKQDSGDSKSSSPAPKVDGVKDETLASSSQGGTPPAAAAVEPTKPTDPPPSQPPTPSAKPKDETAVTKLWYTVAIVEEPTFSVQSYVVPMNEEEYKQDMAVTSKDLTKHPLLPGTAYKFRVAGINVCGRGPWSEMSAFKTCLPGFPGAPSNIKITKIPEGALLNWEPPPNPNGDSAFEYAVYLATKPPNARTDGAIPASQLSFVKVYDDPTPTCTITHENLRYAYYDCSGPKPAIIFRIAAKNEKGYGPATQVRWLQESLPAQAPR